MKETWKLTSKDIRTIEIGDLFPQKEEKMNMSSVETSETAPSIMDRLKTDSDTLKFKIPSSHADALDEKGNPVEKTVTFEFPVCSSEEEANEVIAFKKWNIVDIVNDILKTQARANKYQSATAVYRQTLTLDEMADRVFRDLMRTGQFSEEFAKNQADALRKSGNVSK